ncbi:MAG: methyltransferase domain-containing protein [Candidatus Bathyarchaeota archaeon]|nr:methyltransferase domain-containing protein [Candidatus Termiticorpusculum sp.]
MVHDGYIWDAADYSNNSQHQYQWAKELVSKFKFKGDEVLLDVGCGVGKITCELANLLPNGKVVGIDSSEQMVKLAKNNSSSSKYANLSFEVMDARNIRFQEKFDVVFSNAALHWVLDQVMVLKGVAQCLKSQGRLLFQMGGRGNMESVISCLDELRALPKWKGYFSDFSFPYAYLGVEEYRALLNEAMLTPLRVELLPKVMKFSNAEGLAGFVRTVCLPYTERVPSELRDTFVKQCVDLHMLKQHLNKQDVIQVNMMRLEVEARNNSVPTK